MNFHEDLVLVEFQTRSYLLNTTAQSHNTKYNEHVKLHPQTPPIDKREIGDAAFPGNAEYILLPQPSPPPN